ncbi:hypothetical protein [Neobacillus kokaensis]|uniref:Uncharacterized protein n=1 Tax=Neobacillus kokaensis TaxID=2759023 RepID=A0ABQ3N287_9BACI|nr:hypothetical protein [Neobacillus kokaensis]GHH98221.1 hypothetical protein AM1BK_17640 [Neobacillus kokaensis]
MTDSITEKGKVLSMLAEIHDQLEALESVLEVSFSNQRNQLNRNVQEKLSDTANKLSIMENKISQFNQHSDREEEVVFSTSAKVQNLNWAFK